MKKVFASFIFVVLVAGCGVTKQATVSKQTFTFDYTPKQTNKSGSAGMTLASIKPYYAVGFSSSGTELFTNFRTAISNDIEELIVAKGFTMKGPYQAFSEMVYEDMTKTDMAIQIEIAPSFTSAQGSWKANNALLGAAFVSYSYSGRVSLIGKINLTGIEPLTNVKIWSKSVLIPNVEDIEIQTSGKYTRPLQGDELMQDPGVYNAIGKALMQQYDGILSKIEAHFDPNEFIAMKGQIKDLKSKKGF